MGRKAYLDKGMVTTIECPSCRKTYRKDLARTAEIGTCMQNLDRCLRLRCYCGCGYSFICVTERRRHPRKPARIPARYSQALDSFGRITIRNLSAGGAGFEAFGAVEDLKAGDEITLRFVLDDDSNTPVSRGAVVRTCAGGYFGTEFIRADDPEDPLISYLRDVPERG